MYSYRHLCHLAALGVWRRGCCARFCCMQLTLTYFSFSSHNIVRYNIKLAPHIDVAIPTRAPQEYIYFGEPTCTYQPFETPGVLGGTTFMNPA